MLQREYTTLLRLANEQRWYRQLRRVLHGRIDRFLPASCDAPILDAGCGTGGNLAQLEGMGRRVGLDSSPDALREMNRVHRPGGLLFVDVSARESLTYPHDEAVMTPRRLTAPALRSLVERCGFEMLRVTHWNTLLFPAVWSARSLRLMPTGRDFGTTEPAASGRHALLYTAMSLEVALPQRMPLPFGVSIQCVAGKL